jgi:hypothetical protein
MSFGDFICLDFHKYNHKMETNNIYSMIFEFQ